jgi:hypothetical protein
MEVSPFAPHTVYYGSPHETEYKAR